METVLGQQPRHIELAIKNKRGAPTKIVNKDLELKTYEYKVFTTYDLNKGKGETRASSTRKYLFSNFH